MYFPETLQEIRKEWKIEYTTHPMKYIALNFSCVVPPIKIRALRLIRFLLDGQLKFKKLK